MVAVRRVIVSDANIAQTDRDLGVGDSLLRSRTKKASNPKSDLTSDERSDLGALQQQN